MTTDTPREHRESVPDRLAAIETRLQAVPDGWRQRDGDAGLIENSTGHPVAVLGDSGGQSLPLGEFLAAAPADIRWLTQQLRQTWAQPAPRRTTEDTATPQQPMPWDEAVFRCGRCGTTHTATTEAEYVRAVSAHGDAHELWDRLGPIERDGIASILRVILADAALGTEFLTLHDRQQPDRT
ncbi:hypothetical protein [Streptomyces sp. NPDC002640]